MTDNRHTVVPRAA
ncbi:hypothetical protein YPPY46_2902, partial [Yersinia pestis PY-46]